MECEWAGQGDDPADKGLGKAYTNAIKTFLREQFLIPQGDDPEADERTDARAAQRVARDRQQQRPANGGSARLLKPEELARVVAAIEESGKDMDLILAAVGVDATDDLSTAHAKQIKELISQ